MSFLTDQNPYQKPQPPSLVPLWVMLAIGAAMATTCLRCLAD